MESSAIFVNPEPSPRGERETGSFQLASWGARFGAALIDGLIIFALLLVFGVALLGVVASDGGDGGLTIAAVASGFVVYLVITALYAPTTMAMMNGATPGKRAVGIRVMREDGLPLTFGGAVLRELVFKGFVIGLVGQVTAGLGFLANYLWPLWDAQNRAGHDFMAKTRVVNAR